MLLKQFLAFLPAFLTLVATVVAIAAFILLSLSILFFGGSWGSGVLGCGVEI